MVFCQADKGKRCNSSNSKWRNYDDLNEFFWTRKCGEVRRADRSWAIAHRFKLVRRHIGSGLDTAAGGTAVVLAPAREVQQN